MLDLASNRLETKYFYGSLFHVAFILKIGFDIFHNCYIINFMNVLEEKIIF